MVSSKEARKIKEEEEEEEGKKVAGSFILVDAVGVDNLSRLCFDDQQI